jgi:hypothetical protein
VGLRAKVDLLASPADASPASVWLRIISFSGVGLLHCRQLIVGETVVLRFPTADRRGLLISCEVVHCQSIPNQFYRIGAKFLGEPFGGGHPKVEPSSIPTRTSAQAVLVS